MGKHVATVRWESDGNFLSGTYSRAHILEFDGGASVAGSSSPAMVSIPMSDPAGVDPEEALIAAVAACHMLWFLSIAQAAGLDIVRYRDAASAVMGRNAEGRIAVTRITLRPGILFAGQRPDEAQLARLHHEAHESCFIANSLRTEIVIEPF